MKYMCGLSREDEFEYREGGKEGVYHPENIEDAQTN